MNTMFLTKYFERLCILEIPNIYINVKMVTFKSGIGM